MKLYYFLNYLKYIELSYTINIFAFNHQKFCHRKIYKIIQCADECLTVVGVPLWGRNLSYLYKSGKYFDRFDKI